MFIKQYKITFLDQLGEIAQSSIIAPNKFDAMDTLGIAKHNFISSKVIYKLNHGLEINTQLQILTRVLGGISSGEPHVQYLPSILNDFKVLKPKQKFIDIEIKKGLELSQLLLFIDIDHIAVSLISNGERSGKLAQSIKDAKDFLRLESQTKKATSQTLKANALILFLAIILIFVSPIFVVYFYQAMESSGLTIERNTSTDILFLLNDINVIFGVICTIIITAIVIKGNQFLSLFGKFYPVSIFKNIIETKRSILFLSIFTPLHKAGLGSEQILASYKSINAEFAKKIRNLVLEGLSISDAVQALSFSTTFKSGFKGFNRINNKQSKIDLLDELFQSLTEDSDSYNKQASLFIKVFANTLIYGILVVITMGFVLPQLSIGVAL